MQNQKKYWDSFYNKFFVNEPSNFCKYIIKKKICKKKNRILEVGCGNGRDTFFFLKKNFQILSLDKSHKAILLNQKKINDIFFCKDISNLSKADVVFFKNKKIDIVYARFFIHTLNFENENKFFKFCNNILIPNGKILLEFRTIHDPLINKGKKISETERLTDHYRRFIDTSTLIEKLKKKFKPVYCTQQFGLAKFKNENPHICRLILRKLR